MTGQRHYGRHTRREKRYVHRDRNETKGRVKTFTRRRKAEGNGWAEVERENEKRRMHRQRSFATPVTRCCIYSYTAAAPTPPMARSFACIPASTREDRDGKPGERSEKRETKERKRQAWQQWPLLYVLPSLAAVSLAPALSVSLASL